MITFAGKGDTSSKSPSAQWKERVSIVLGHKIADSFVNLKTGHMEGWILGNIESGSSRDNTFIRKNVFYMYLNKRPIDPVPKLHNFLNEVYRKYNKSTKFVYIINLILPWNHYDVNLAPNKREILIK